MADAVADVGIGSGRRGAAGMTKLFFTLALFASFLSGCGDDDAADKAAIKVAVKVAAKATPITNPAPVAVKFGKTSVNDILRDIMRLKFDDHAGMVQAIRNNAAGYCSEGKLGAGINQLPVATTASQSRRDQSNTFAVKDALQDAMHPLEERYRAQQVKQLYAGIVRRNDRVYIRTIVMGCFLKVPGGKNLAQSD